MIALAAALTLGCTGRTIAEDNSSADTPTDTPIETTWSPCFTKGEYVTCAEVCAVEDSVCVESGCPANPNACLPDSCNTATYTVAALDVICTDATLGGFIDKSCDKPIGWQFNSIGRCCCAI
ncbi:MAG: hypothetical protein HC927_02245 [Deltaproteobacteria bacterium]|nr:hypothetical protein [Deltaproteobacteria bacterium]